MRKWKISPLIALCIVGSLVAWALLAATFGTQQTMSAGAILRDTKSVSSRSSRAFSLRCWIGAAQARL